MKGHARNLMVERVTSVDVLTSLADVGRLLAGTSFGGVPVIDQSSKVVGFVSETDVLDAFLRGVDNDVAVGDIMSHPPIVVDEFATTDDVMTTLRESHIRHLPVVRDGKLVGIITPHDVLRFLVSRLPPPRELA